MSDNEDNIFDDENSFEVDTDEESARHTTKKKQTKITIQPDNDDSDFEDDENDENDDDGVDDKEENIEIDNDDLDDIDADDDSVDLNNDDESIKNDEDGNMSGDEDDIDTKRKQVSKMSLDVGTDLPEDMDVYGASSAMNPQLFEDNEEDEDPDENYLQKFETNIKENYVSDFHPETSVHNYEEIVAMAKVVRDKNNIIVDPLHKTIPVLTKYERARVLGQRAKQIDNGSKPYVAVPDNIIEGHLIAQLELEQKRIPFIIRRPLPGNAGSEYWSLKDLEILTM